MARRACVEVRGLVIVNVHLEHESPHPPKFNRFISALNRGSDRSGS